MKALTLAALALTGLAGGAGAEEASAPALPGWMAGCWVQEQDGRWSEECWTAPRGGIMLGSGRNGLGERLGSWEVMQIVLEPTAGIPLAFFGAPRGEGRTLFAWQPGGEGLTFVNAAHDYPQRVRYWRSGERLMAEVSLLDGSKASRWSYRRNGMPDKDRLSPDV